MYSKKIETAAKNTQSECVVSGCLVLQELPQVFGDLPQVVQQQDDQEDATKRNSKMDEGLIKLEIR